MTLSSLEMDCTIPTLKMAYLSPNLKEQCHEDFAVLGQFCAKIITLKL